MNGETALVALMHRAPALGLWACDLAAAIIRIAGYGLRREAIQFPRFDDRAWKEACRQRLRSRIVREVSVRKGVVPFRAIASDALASLRGPAILATFHVGAMEGLGVALDQLTAPVLVFKGRQTTLPIPHVTIRRLDRDDPQQRALMIHDAVERLRRDELVLLAVDGGQDGSLEIPCLGHTMKIARGAFALSRITGAPVIPIVARWRGTRVEVVVGEPLEAQAERELATAAVHWLERYLLDAPGEIGPAIERFSVKS